jgi:hypothetical protein
MNLISTLEIQIMIAKQAEMQRQMRELQRKISHELAQRFVQQVESDELVLKELEQLVQTKGQGEYNSSLPIPIFISSNDSFIDYR